jgi:uncharacterized protein
VILMDVNVLVYAHREDVADHTRWKQWLEGVLRSEESFGLSDLVLSGFVRVVTHPRVFTQPTPVDVALEFCNVLRGAPNAVLLQPGPRHWDIFQRLCHEGKAKGNLVSDACHAALAIETGSEWQTTDRDYARFPGLRWRNPLA